MELLQRLDHPQTSSANATKLKMAAIIVGALPSHEGWASATLSNVQLASSSRDVADLPSLAFSLELLIESPLRLFFPAGGVLPPAAEPEVEQQNANGVGLVPPQPLAPLVDQMMLQEQKMAMSEQKMAMSEQKAAMSEQKAAAERLEVSAMS